MFYRTIEGDRWDLISYRFYNNPDKYKFIIKANPYLDDKIKLSPILPAGVEIYLPDIEKDTLYPEELPPWKR